MLGTSKHDHGNIHQSSRKPTWVFRFHYSGQKFWLTTSGLVADLKSSLTLNGMVVEEFILIPSLEFWYGF